MKPVLVDQPTEKVAAKVEAATLGSLGATIVFAVLQETLQRYVPILAEPAVFVPLQAFLVGLVTLAAGYYKRERMTEQKLKFFREQVDHEAAKPQLSPEYEQAVQSWKRVAYVAVGLAVISTIISILGIVMAQ